MDNNLDKVLTHMKITQTKELLAKIAIGLSEQTKIVIVPRGTIYYQIVSRSNDSLTDHILVPLYDILGRYIGYDEDYNILIMWES